MRTAYDLVVLGTGSGGEVVAGELARAGSRVAAVDEARVGGECPYVACVPSKALLLAAREHVLVGGDHAVAYAAAVERRDEAAEQQDDSGAAQGLQDAGVDVVRGRGVLAGRSSDDLLVTVTAADGSRRDLTARAVVLNTGSEPVVPPIDGLDDVATWTSDEALSSPELPGRLAILGGGAVGCELAQVYASFGAQVVLLEAGPGLLGNEPAWVGERLATALRQLGVDVRLGARVSAAEPDGTGLRLTMDEGVSVRADRLLLAGGRRPRSADLGLGTLGVGPADDGSLVTDARCRVLGPGGEPVAGLHAVGDVTAVAPYTHTATYQGRIVAAHLLGRGRDADYTAIPSAIYTDPAVYSVGEDAEAARARGVDALVEGIELSNTGRGFIAGAGGRLELVVDACDGRLIGAAAVGPDADSWAGELGLAVRARLDVRLLADHVHGFPTWAEAVQPVAARLAARLDLSGGRAEDPAVD